MHQTIAKGDAHPAGIPGKQADPRMQRIFDYLPESLAKIYSFDAPGV